MEDAHSRDTLRVVGYGGAPPVLEKRHFYLDSKSNQWRHGKVRGLNGLDFALAIDRLEEFREVLLSPWTARRKSTLDDGLAAVRESVS